MKELIRHIIREHTREIILEMPKKSNREEFIKKAIEKHGDKYDYSNVNYINSKTDVEIICPIHGVFNQRPNNHLNGAECPKCYDRSDKISSDTPKFIEKARKIHGDTYDYSEVDYISAKTPVKIICPIHGVFLQKPNDHLNGNGCQECGKDRLTGRPSTVTTSSFLKDVKKIHGKKYNYDKTIYDGYKNDVIVTCPKHGDFLIKPGNLLKGSGCKKCAFEKIAKDRTWDTEDFIENAKEIHGNTYDYSITDYKSIRVPVKIICPIHGEFTQKPFVHLNGSGCQKCQESKGEKFVSNLLKKNNINFESQYKFTDCTNKVEGKYCRKLPFDFYLPKNNVCIEYDGAQHYIPVWGEDDLKKVQNNDKIKNQYCKKNGIKLIRIPYTMKKEDIEPYILQELGL
jgi:very-short-patch-repair endonuclease